MHHLMVELFSLDDVGQSYDIALTQPERVNVTLGRHTNDLMTSFYCKSPSSFMIECGWGGREIDPATWQPVEMHAGPSLWGHDGSGCRRTTAKSRAKCGCAPPPAGLRAPVQVMDGNYKLMSGTCPWWDGVTVRTDSNNVGRSSARPVIASEAKQSIEPERQDWIAPSLCCLAMTRETSTPDAS